MQQGILDSGGEAMSYRKGDQQGGFPVKRRWQIGDDWVDYTQWGAGYPTLFLQDPECPLPAHRAIVSQLGFHLSLYIVDQSPQVNARLLGDFLNHLGISRVNIVACPGSAELAVGFAEGYARRTNRILLVCGSEMSCSVTLVEEVPIVVTPTQRLTTDGLDFLGRRPALAFAW